MSTNDDIPMPSGNGDKDCPHCRGRGVVPLEIRGWPGAGTQNCDCVFKRDLVANVKRVWKVLLSVESVATSPLLKLTTQNLWLTASSHTLRRHLRHVAFRMGTQWDARVIADASLMSAWLATAKGVRDPDVTNPSDSAREFDGPPSNAFMTLLDLVAPYGLLIIRLGIKSAANKEMANVLAEALNERDMLGKPTWVIDDPARPLAPGHKCYNEDVLTILGDYERLVLRDEAGAPTEAAQYTAKPLPQGVVPVGGLAASNYSAKPTAIREAIAASPVPAPRPASAPRAPDPDDDDEFSVSSLVAAAINPTPVPIPGGWTPERDTPLDTDEVPDADFDVEDALEHYPTAAELRSNGSPSWMAKLALTTDDRKAAQKKAKQDKKGGRGR